MVAYRLQWLVAEAAAYCHLLVAEVVAEIAEEVEAERRVVAAECK